MQYLGGKSRLARRIVAAIREDFKGEPSYVWDPFCGGLSMSVELCRVFGADKVTSSDFCKPLISLYSAVQSGWCPPRALSETQYRACRQLPDSDPLKAFAGFGCSFGGKWFGGYARISKTGQDYVDIASRVVVQDCGQISNEIRHLSFLDVPPICSKGFIYCDPPYRGTQGYSAVAAFDHERFWSLVFAWAALGSVVYVSEFSAPPNVKELLSFERPRKLQRAGADPLVTEKLYVVRAPSVPELPPPKCTLPPPLPPR